MHKWGTETCSLPFSYCIFRVKAMCMLNISTHDSGLALFICCLFCPRGTDWYISSIRWLVRNMCSDFHFSVTMICYRCVIIRSKAWYVQYLCLSVKLDYNQFSVLVITKCKHGDEINYDGELSLWARKLANISIKLHKPVSKPHRAIMAPRLLSYMNSVKCPDKWVGTFSGGSPFT